MGGATRNEERNRIHAVIRCTFFPYYYFSLCFFIKFIKQYFLVLVRGRGVGVNARAKTPYSFEAKMTTYRDRDLKKGK